MQQRRLVAENRTSFGARSVDSQALQSALQAMTGSLVYLGPQPERAAAFKLYGNLTLLGILGVLRGEGQLDVAAGVRVPKP